MGQSRVTPIGRASFPHLNAVSSYNKYTLTMLLSKADPKVTEFVTWLKKAVHDEATAIAGQAGVAKALSVFTAFKDGDNPALFTTYRGEYANHFVLNMSRKAEFGKPCVVNRNRQPIDASEIYPGCDVIAFIDVYGYNFGGKKGVSIGFQHVMKVSDNTPFASTGRTTEDAFANLELPEENSVVPEAPFGKLTPEQVDAKFKPKAEAVVDPFAGL